MSASSTIDATDPTTLLSHVDVCNNAVIAARLGGPPPQGMVAGMSPPGIASAEKVCTPETSVIGMSFVESLGPAANLPQIKSSFAATFGISDTPAVAPTPLIAQEFKT